MVRKAVVGRRDYAGPRGPDQPEIRRRGRLTGSLLLFHKNRTDVACHRGLVHEEHVDGPQVRLVHARERFPRGKDRQPDQPSTLPNLRSPRARARAASTSRSRGGACVISWSSRRRAASATSSTARPKAAWLARDGLVKPLTFRTNRSHAARPSGSAAEGS